VELDSYADAGVRVAVELVNALAVEHAHGRASAATEPRPVIERILAVDPPSRARLDDRDVPGFIALARRLRAVFDELAGDDVDAAATAINGMLADHPAHPHLAKDAGRWRLHHHPADADLVPMCTSICAEALARMIGAGHGDRLGTCRSRECDRVFVDLSKNASRRFCSTTCQNRVKAAAFRRRRVDGAATRQRRVPAATPS
jgi:predicted RNA-binding Zn ribbon-like protein